MSAEILSFVVVVAGIVIGAVMVWLITRSRTAAQVDAAVARAESAVQIELGLLQERARASGVALDEVQTRVGSLGRELSQSQTDLNAAYQQIATLQERLVGLPALRREFEDQNEQLHQKAEQMLVISSSLSEKSETSRLLGTRLTEMENDKAELENQLSEATSALQTVNQRNAGLEEQVAHLSQVSKELDAAQHTSQALASELAQTRESSSGEIGRLGAELSAERDAHALVREALVKASTGRLEAEARVNRLNDELTQSRTLAEADARSATEKLAALDDAKIKLSDAFRTLASDILEEKSKRFAEQNQTALGQMLDPLRLQLSEFKGKVEEVYVQESKDRSALSEQVKQLFGLNQAISEDAKRLTNALKGEAKTQGNWGEMILERVLEASGLRKGHEYVVQDSQVREDGSRAQPDVVIHLPEDRKIVVDAKVSLLAYDELTRADSDESRALGMRRHLDSVRGHIKGLSEKKYQALYGLQSLDFVLMFVPVEPAFMTAVTGDANLFMDAWERNVLLVSPSTLLFVVRTVAHLWRQEQQSRNAQEIAKRGAELYDRLSDFVKDLETIGDRLRQAQTSYDAASKRLSQGKGNVIRQAEMLKDLGVKATKALPAAMLAAMHADVDKVDSEALAALPSGIDVLPLVAGQPVQ